MTTDTMNCDRFSDRLMDYLEQTADETTRAAVERHAASCAECGVLLADLRKLRVDAAHLPELTPSRDLWSDIAARIETPVVSIASAAGGDRGAAGSLARSVRPRLRRWMKTGLLAASVIGAAALGYMVRGSEPQIIARPPLPAASEDGAPVGVVLPPAEQTVAEVPVARDAGTGAARSVVTNTRPEAASASTAPASGARPVEVQLAVATLTADYDREIARLRALLEQRRTLLDPATVTVIERNLAVIDTAIAESRRALANDPSSRFLIEFLNQSLQAKVELMRTAALLPSRT